MSEINKGLSIVMPAYNEQDAIGIVIDKLLNVLRKADGLKSEIIVVDDGSTDNTASVAEKKHVKLVRHPKNMGYGKAIAKGAVLSQYNYIAIIDADDTYNPEDLLKMIPLMGTFDMVTGVRNMKGMKQHIFVKCLRVFLYSIILYVTGCSSPDPNSGLRLFRKTIIQKGQSLFSMKFSFSTSLTVFAHLNNLFVEYMPIGYSSRIGISKVRHVRDSVRTFMLILSMSLMHRPLKCFLAHIAITIIGFAILTCLNFIFGNPVWVMMIFLWFFITLFAALGYMSFILSKIYEKLQNEK